MIIIMIIIIIVKQLSITVYYYIIHTIIRTYVWLSIFVCAFCFNGPWSHGARQVAGVLVNLDPKSPNATWIQISKLSCCVCDWHHMNNSPDQWWCGDHLIY